MSSIAGSFGYMPPEYAYATKVNKNVDVYSFGVVLLELTTGRGPIDEDGLVNLAEWANQHYSMGNPITDALDDNIKEPAYLEGMTIVFKLGICCTNILPSCRPSMGDVLQILLKYCSLNDKSSIITTGTKDELSLTVVDDLQK